MLFLLLLENHLYLYGVDKMMKHNKFPIISMMNVYHLICMFRIQHPILKGHLYLKEAQLLSANYTVLFAAQTEIQ